MLKAPSHDFVPFYLLDAKFGHRRCRTCSLPACLGRDLYCSGFASMTASFPFSNNKFSKTIEPCHWTLMVKMHYTGAVGLEYAALAVNSLASTVLNPPVFLPPALPPTLTPLFVLATQADDFQTRIPRLVGDYQSGEKALIYFQGPTLMEKQSSPSRGQDHWSSVEWHNPSCRGHTAGH